MIPSDGLKEKLTTHQQSTNPWAVIDELKRQLAEAIQEREIAKGHATQFRADFEAELAGNAALRKQYGARDGETMFDFHARVVAEREAAIADAAAMTEFINEVSELAMSATRFDDTANDLRRLGKKLLPKWNPAHSPGASLLAELAALNSLPVASICGCGDHVTCGPVAAEDGAACSTCASALRDELERARADAAALRQWIESGIARIHAGHVESFDVCQMFHCRNTRGFLRAENPGAPLLSIAATATEVFHTNGDVFEHYRRLNRLRDAVEVWQSGGKTEPRESAA